MRHPIEKPTAAELARSWVHPVQPVQRMGDPMVIRYVIPPEDAGPGERHMGRRVVEVRIPRPPDDGPATWWEVFER